MDKIKDGRQPLTILIEDAYKHVQTRDFGIV